MKATQDGEAATVGEGRDALGPDPQPGGNDPSWWPEFERQLAVYLAERDGGRQQAAVLASAGAVRHDMTDPV